MGEEFVCPYCDHVDSIQGECPDCGGNLTKLEDDPDDANRQEIEGEDNAFSLAESEISELDDFGEPETESEYREGGLRVA